MDTRGAYKNCLASSQFVVEKYLADLTDAELLARPIPGINHIAWQLGHIIAAEHDMVEAVRPGSMPALPAGFREKHTKEAATSDDPKQFATKEEYLAAMKKQRAGTLAVLESLKDADFDAPAPEAMRAFLQSTGDVFSMQSTHWLMHAGQWAVIRRKLGRKPLF